MNALLTLKTLDSWFLNNTLKTKIQLYILPFLVLILILNFIPKDINIPVEKNSFEQTYHLKTSMFEISKQIENLAKESNFSITNINQYEKTLHIKGVSQKIENIKIFIEKLEFLNAFSNISNLRILKNQNYILETSISFDKYFIKTTKKVERKEPVKIINEEKKQKDEKKSEIKKEFFLNAIVLEYAFINNQWIKLHEKIDNYELIIVKRDFVILKNRGNEIKVEIKHDKSDK